MRKILIMGLPGSGKTTLAKALAPLLSAVHFNADAVRGNINKDLGFSPEDRIEQARRMRWLCDQVVAAGHYAIADFVCPTREAREAFGPAYVIYMDTGAPCRYADTVALFEPPDSADCEIYVRDASFNASVIADEIATLGSTFDRRKPTAFFLGRYQPFHEGHRALVLEGLHRVGQACIAVRDTACVDASNPFRFAEIRDRICAMMANEIDRIEIISVPNVTNVFYGRDVGYGIERIDLGDDLHAISATDIRKAMGPAT